MSLSQLQSKKFASKIFAAFVLSHCLCAQVNVVTQHNDIGRTGQNLNEVILTPTNVSSGNFGKLFSVAVDGQVYTQPLYLSGLAIPNQGTHNVAFVATENDSVYAFDADTAGPPLWQASLLDAAHGASAGATTDPISDTGCDEISGPTHGVTGTPVIDPIAGTIYLVSKTVENGYPVQRLHALSVTTGAEKPNSPVVLAASVKGTGNGSSNGLVTFDPKWENQRPGLLLLNGIVYMAFGSHCDFGPYHGWVLAYNATTMQQTSAFLATPNGTGSGIWMSGAGLAADVPAGSPYGRMFLTTGNGTYDATTPYTTNNVDYGDDVLRLDLTNGVMTVTDAFTPHDQASLSTNDLDIASSGVMLLPDQPLAGHTHQMLTGGKVGTLYLVDRDNLGGYNNSGTTDNDIKSVINQVAGVFSVPAYWNNNVYIWSQQDYMTQFSVVGGLMNSYYIMHGSEFTTFPGSSPSISANGNTNAIVWAIDSSGWETNSQENLLAHDATNINTTLYNSANNANDNPGLAVKFGVPTVVNGKVYVGAFGQLSVFGLKTPDFSLTPASSGLTLTQGGTTTDSITVNSIYSFSGNVTLSASGLPTGVTASFAPGSTSGTIVMTLTATSAAPTGSSTITITGTSGTLSHSTTLTLQVAAGLQSQVITFSPIPSQTAGSTLVLTSTASSGLPVTYTSSTSSVCSVTGSSVSLLTAGTCTIQASQPGNSTYSAAASVTQSFAVSAAATVSTVPFISAQTPGSLRNNYSGFVGFQFTVGTSPITIYSLGRLVALGNSGSHTVKLVQVSTNTVVPGASVSLTMNGSVGQYQYAALSAPVTLTANTAYYLVSQETAGADSWYDIGPVTASSVAAVNGPVYTDAGNNYMLVKGLTAQSYVPVNFLYAVPPAPLSVTITSPQAAATISGNGAIVTVSTTGSVASLQLQVDGVNTGAANVLTLDTTTLTNATHVLSVVATDTTSKTATSPGVSVTVSNVPVSTQNTTSFVTAQSPGSLRNNYTGYVGFALTVGASPLVVTSLGRYVAPGDSGIHTLKLVNSSGIDVPGGSVSISLATAQAGQYFYGSLPATVTLQASTTYYLVSQETQGGDQWYDFGAVTTTTVASVSGPVYTDSFSNYVPVKYLSGYSYVPLSFLYQAAAVPVSASITSPQANATISGNSVSVSVATTGSFTSLQLQVDGVNAGAALPVSGSQASPYTLTLNTSALTPGQHALTVQALQGSVVAAVSPSVSITVSNVVTPTSFISSEIPSSLRNNYTGFVGASITVGSTPLTVTSLGRLFATGNTGTHTLKLVQANGTDVPGASVSVSLSGGTAGQFVYTTLTTPVTLSANTSYYLVSQETAGGDMWYDVETVVNTSAGQVSGPAYTDAFGNYVTVQGLSNCSFVPVSFLYH